MPYANGVARDLEGQLLFPFEHSEKNGRLGLLSVSENPRHGTAIGTSSVVRLPVSSRGDVVNRARTGNAPAQQLTVRERQVLDLLVRGLSSKCIAHELVISPRTVEVHRANLMRKMGVRNIAALVRTVFEAA